MRCLPALAVDWHGRELERLGTDGRVGARHRYGFADHARDFLFGHQRRSGKSPGAIHDHAYAEAEGSAVGNHGYFERLAGAALRIEPHRDKLLPVADDPYIGVRGFQALGFAQSHATQVFQLGIRFGGTFVVAEQTCGQGRGCTGFDECASGEQKLSLPILRV